MHVKAKEMAFAGLLAAFTVVLLILSSVIETSSLFFLVAASFCVGIVLREWRIRAGIIFLAASFLAGLLVAPDKLYCLTFLVMGMYLILSELLWEKIADSSKIRKKKLVIWAGKYLIFNCILIPVLVFFPSLILTEKAVEKIFIMVWIGAQAALFVFEKAYEYFQIFIWGRLRNKLLK